MDPTLITLSKAKDDIYGWRNIRNLRNDYENLGSDAIAEDIEWIKAFLNGKERYAILRKMRKILRETIGWERILAVVEGGRAAEV
jgi:hypothetical protein